MILTGDALEQLRKLPDESVQVCVTSPPYYRLRMYGGGGLEIGLENTPDEYITSLVNVFREVRRVLRNDGTLWLNIGDSYVAGTTGNSVATKSSTLQGGKATQIEAAKRLSKLNLNGLKPKDMIGIPWMLAFALRADGWYLRQDIIWAKRNCMPESVKDRCTKSHEYIFLLSKSAKYYYDSDAIKEKALYTAAQGHSQSHRYGGNKYTATPDQFYRTKSGSAYAYTGFKNKRDVWHIATTPFKGAHFATFPEKLVEPCIIAGSKRGDVVLDPFSGAGTTGVVAKKQGREYIGIELNPEYVKLSEDRIAKIGETARKKKAKKSKVDPQQMTITGWDMT